MKISTSFQKNGKTITGNVKHQFDTCGQCNCKECRDSSGHDTGEVTICMHCASVNCSIVQVTKGSNCPICGTKATY